MRSAVTMVGLALFVAACGSTTNNTPGTSGGSTGQATTGGAATGASGGSGGETAGSSSGGTTTGGTYVDAGLVDGTQCTADLACASHVCGLSGTGNCCALACTSTNATCAATGCDTSGNCLYPSMAAMGGAAPACGGTCVSGLLDAFFCDTSGNCSVSTGQAFPCPNSFGCDPKGEACNTSCTTDGDCFAGAFCLNSVCSPRLTTGPCVENDGCVTQVCDIAGSGNCCKAACAATKDPACSATNCDANSGACVFPAAKACGVPSCTNSLFTVTGDGMCDATGACIETPSPCPSNLGCNAAGTACNTTCAVRTDCATGFYCSNSQCIPELPLGACTENDECVSDFCGTTGSGNCCAAACAATADPKCDPINCDATAGGCVYPAGFACGAASCTSNVLNFACNASGACVANSAVCAGNLTCNATGTDCNATCASDADCVSNYYCFNGACDLRVALGACPINDGCTSGVCGGATGSGNCCTAACPDTVAACAATDCSAKTGACIYPTATTACGTILASCANGIEDDPSVCDGAGNCPTPGTSICSPYICDSTSNACFTSCSDNTSCASGDFCDTNTAVCCSGLTTGGTINVDGKKGKDAACCGVNGNTPCLTLTRAMSLIDAAQAQGVTINAYINGLGGGGNWSPKGESYPITLGWGAELSAPAVYFFDLKTAAEIFDIDFYSTNDTVGYASIAGQMYNPVYIGWDENGDEPDTTSSIQVEASNTLYIANATVNGSQNNMTTAITVAAGGTLMLGQDQSAGNTGTVNIGQNGQPGWSGIVCQTDSVSLGCTITDANLNGTTAVNIVYQENLDIDAEDFASISLTSNPTIGEPPASPGFTACAQEYGKPDSQTSDSEAILLNGDVTMTFNNGTVQCISGDGFLMKATKEGTPTLNMDSSTIQNVEYGVEATAGTATISNTTFQYLFTGVDQNTDGTNIATIDLSGGSVGGTNTVACANSVESIYGAGGKNGASAVAVLDSTTANLNASNTNWDTTAPDEFSCTNASLNNCTCEVTAGCTDTAGADGMDAVYDNTGTVTTTGNGSASQNCTPPVICSEEYETSTCPSGTVCCPQDPYYPCCEPADLCADYCD